MNDDHFDLFESYLDSAEGVAEFIDPEDEDEWWMLDLDEDFFDEE